MSDLNKFLFSGTEENSPSFHQKRQFVIQMARADNLFQKKISNIDFFIKYLQNVSL